MSLPQGHVHIIDDDQFLVDEIADLVTSVGHIAHKYTSAEAFLRHLDASTTGCVVTDVRMRGMNGIELQEAIVKKRLPLPVVVISAYPSTEVAVRMMRNGAVTVLDKPFEHQHLLDAIHAALATGRDLKVAAQAEEEVRTKLGSLTAGERQVLEQVLAGAANKAIAYDLGVSLRTVEMRRHMILKKLRVGSVAELVRYVLRAGPVIQSQN